MRSKNDHFSSKNRVKTRNFSKFCSFSHSVFSTRVLFFNTILFAMFPIKFSKRNCELQVSSEFEVGETVELDLRHHPIFPIPPYTPNFQNGVGHEIMSGKRVLGAGGPLGKIATSDLSSFPLTQIPPSNPHICLREIWVVSHREKYRKSSGFEVRIYLSGKEVRKRSETLGIGSYAPV